jgi:hypothetical protein
MKMKTHNGNDDNFLGDVILTRTNPGWQPTSLIKNPNPSNFELVAGDFALAQNFKENFPWVAGDIINYLRSVDENYANQFLESVVGLEEAAGKYNNYAWVASAFPIATRKYDLRWSHYRSAASIADANKRNKALERAELDHLNTADFAKLCKAIKEGQPEPDLDFNAIPDEVQPYVKPSSIQTEQDEIDEDDVNYNPEDEEFGSDATPFHVTTVSVTLPEGVKKRAENFAKTNSLTMSDLVTAALNTYLEGR